MFRLYVIWREASGHVEKIVESQAATTDRPDDAVRFRLMFDSRGIPLRCFCKSLEEIDSKGLARLSAEESCVRSLEEAEEKRVKKRFFSDESQELVKGENEAKAIRGIFQEGLGGIEGERHD